MKTLLRKSSGNGQGTLITVKELLGHKTLTMTLRHSHLAPSHKVKAVDILDNVLNEKRIIQEPKEKPTKGHCLWQEFT